MFLTAWDPAAPLGRSEAVPDAPVTAYIGIGGNLGDARATVERALRALATQLPGCQGLRASSLYRSAPVDAGGPDFVNAVAALQTTLSPLALLHALQALEQAEGRERPYRNAPRTLDLDVLMYGALRLDSPELTVPHPRCHERAFVLLPLAELWPEGVRPDALAAVADQRIERL